jgi:hypothetical protein
MLPDTYRATPSSAIRLASPPLLPRPTPSATIISSPTRSLSPMSRPGSGRLVSWTTVWRRSAHTRKMVLVFSANFPGVGQSVNVDLVVARLPVGNSGGRS